MAMTGVAAQRESRLVDRWPAALAIVTVAFALGAVVAGAGFRAHRLWDAHHFKVGKVVHRSRSEHCAVIDIPTGFALIVAGLA